MYQWFQWWLQEWVVLIFRYRLAYRLNNNEWTENNKQLFLFGIRKNIFDNKSPLKQTISCYVSGVGLLFLITF